jgi:hypothetical protein
MKYNTLFKEWNQKTTFVEFSSMREVNTIFKFVHNLPGGSCVSRYILPSLEKRYNCLSERAYKLRKCTDHYQTKILYNDHNLFLYMKTADEPSWTLDEDPLPESTPLPSPDCIPQLDGQDDLVRPGTSSRVHESPYTLNQERQTARICKDATATDMNISINNNDTNVNINCSTGFYIVVVKPCLSGISQGSVTQYPPIQVTCTDFTRLSFSLRGPDLASLGSVCLHFRHTTRLVQVQGSAKMPDKSTAAVWFTENVLSERFWKLAKTKQFDISSYNNRVLEMSRSHHNSLKSTKYCFHCEKLFSGQSRPTQCESCHQYLHKICMRPHTSSCHDAPALSTRISGPSSPQRPTKRPRTSLECASLQQVSPQTNPVEEQSDTPLALEPFMSSLSASLVNSGIPTFTGNRTRISFVPNVSGPDASASTIGSTSTVTSVASSQITSTSFNLLSSVPLNSAAPAFTPQSSQDQQDQAQVDSPLAGNNPYLSNISRAASSNSSRNNTKQTRVPPKKNPRTDMSSESVQIDYLTTELNFTHTKIVSQDNTIKDLEHKVKILEATLKLSEEKLSSDLHQKYFGISNRGVPSPSVTCYHCPCAAPPPPSCHRSPPPQPPDQIPPQHAKNVDSSFASKTDFNQLRSVVDSIRVDILQLNSIVSSMSPQSSIGASEANVSTTANKNPPQEPPEIVVDAEIHNMDDDLDRISLVSTEELVPEVETAQDTAEPATNQNHLN